MHLFCAGIRFLLEARQGQEKGYVFLLLFSFPPSLLPQSTDLPFNIEISLEREGGGGALYRGVRNVHKFGR